MSLRPFSLHSVISSSSLTVRYGLGYLYSEAVSIPSESLAVILCQMVGMPTTDCMQYTQTLSDKESRQRLPQSVQMTTYRI